MQAAKLYHFIENETTMRCTAIASTFTTTTTITITL